MNDHGHGRTMKRYALATFLVLAATLAGAASQPTQIRAAAAVVAGTAYDAAALYDERGWLERFYGARAYMPAWSGSGEAAGAISLLKHAYEHGLAPEDYAVADSDAATFDARLTLAMLRYLGDLHAGRTRAGFQHPVPDPRVRDFDPVTVLAQALGAHQLASAVDAAAPKLALYRRLMSALAMQRALVAAPWPELPALPAGRKTLAAGDAYAGAGALAERLATLGDLAPAEVTHGSYAAPLVEAVKRFQGRHGLDADGRIGPQTWRALAVPPARRMRQIELAMERLRWLPDLTDGPAVAINLPSFQLWAFEAGNPARPTVQMRVIVGKAMKTPTPLFIGAMRHIEFNPYWNVPRSIERGEILPKLARDPAYLDKNDMELVGAGNAVTGLKGEAAVSAMRSGAVRVRQRPGPGNALGAIKFVLPNAMNIYLHSTPARALFQRSRRDFSHGCIRLEDPAALARFVLADRPEWTAEAVETALLPGPTRTVMLAKPVPVVIFYTTAIVGREGNLLFAEDIYGLDELLEKSLTARAAGRRSLAASSL